MQWSTSTQLSINWSLTPAPDFTSPDEVAGAALGEDSWHRLAVGGNDLSCLCSWSQALPGNLHLDNFNRQLRPYRIASASVFLDDLAEGGTVFPLMSYMDEEGRVVAASHLASQEDELNLWNDRLNMYRRVEVDELNEFRRQTLLEALAMCQGDRLRQAPVVPEKGTAYFWRNYGGPGGEDEVRAIHAGCGAKNDLKIIATAWFRDGPGPYDTHDAFWSPTWLEEQEAESSSERQLSLSRLKIEAIGVRSFQENWVRELYLDQQKAAESLWGREGKVEMAARQREHFNAKTWISNELYYGLVDEVGYGFTLPVGGPDIKRSKEGP
ncbi:unnamed protein product [Polarella glacialis]|uniref:Uncharacterized protein n=1 Tax=Polarella glacialis TaxID=89957 RepID=A0A813KWE4_POLGL|nr:unnamed protein product [Polarella glacialis]